MQRPPTFEKFHATEVSLNDSMMTIRIDVYVNYQGTLKRTFSYTVPVNQEELEDPDYML